MNQFCGYLAANIRVAFNLQQAKEAEVREAARSALAARAAVIGCRLQRCYLDPDSDGSCDCGPGLRDREDNPVGDMASNEPAQDLGMFTLLVDQLEANGGLR